MAKTLIETGLANGIKMKYIKWGMDGDGEKCIVLLRERSRNVEGYPHLVLHPVPQGPWYVDEESSSLPRSSKSGVRGGDRDGELSRPCPVVITNKNNTLLFNHYKEKAVSRHFLSDLIWNPTTLPKKVMCYEDMW